MRITKSIYFSFRAAFVCMMFIRNITTLCQLSQLTNLLFNFNRNRSNQKFLFWFNIYLIFTYPSPKLWKCYSIFWIELNKIWYNTSKYLWICLICSPFVYELSSIFCIKNKCFKVINRWWVLEDTSSDYCHSNRKYLWLNIFFIVSSS